MQMNALGVKVALKFVNPAQLLLKKHNLILNVMFPGFYPDQGTIPPSIIVRTYFYPRAFVMDILGFYRLQDSRSFQALADENS